MSGKRSPGTRLARLVVTGDGRCRHVRLADRELLATVIGSTLKALF